MILQTYNDYSIAFIEAIQSKDLENFINSLNNNLAYNFNNYLAWLFSARAYEKLGEAAKANNCYEQALKLVGVKSKQRLIQEIEDSKKNKPSLELEQNSLKIKHKDNKEFPEKEQTKQPLQQEKITLQRTGLNYHKELQNAQNYSQKGKYEKAIQVYENLLTNGYNNTNVIQFYAIALQKIENKDKAVQVLDIYIAKTNNEQEKAKLFLSKAQLLSAFNDYEKAETAYLDLVNSYKKIGKPNKAIAHILQQIAQIQYLHLNKHEEALKTIEYGQKLKPNDSFFEELIERVNNYKIALETGEEFQIDSDDEQIDFISPMLKMDLDDYQFTDDEILKLDGKPTLDIAERLLNKAVSDRDGDLSERFPIYLEAAKAFNELPTGSYIKDDYDNKIETALAKYAVLKGNSLFNNYFKKITDIKDLSELARIKDSACSYFIEALNLQYRTKNSLLLPITNYLKLQVAHYLLENQIELPEYFQNKKFSDVFKYCIDNDFNELEYIAFNTIITCGTASLNVWNALLQEKGGPGGILFKRGRGDKRHEIYKLISKIEETEFNTKQSPRGFFRDVFNNRKSIFEKLELQSKGLMLQRFSPRNISLIMENWHGTISYKKNLTQTDVEIISAIQIIINLFKPYNSRLPEERTKILHDIRLRFDELLKFIKTNTTYAGRVIFFPLIKKWRQDLSIIEKERFDETIPKIRAVIDPSYYFYSNEEYYFNLVLNNTGVATANNIKMLCITSNLSGTIEKEDNYELNSELAVNEQKDLKIIINNNIIKENAIKVLVEIIAIYQGAELNPQSFEFTIEKEPENNLTLNDIPWKETSIPTKTLFKGRNNILEDLIKHYKSIHREFTYIMYGLTRTGKSSIIEYLAESINYQKFRKNGEEYTFICFKWRLEKAAAQTKVEDMWYFLLYDSTLKPISQFFTSPEIQTIANKYNPNKKLRFKDWENIIDELISAKYYPLFLIDEFSYYKTLVDSGRLNNAFLASMRQFAFDNKASFLFAGTYDVKALIKNSKYAITGQLVNTIEYEVNKIDLEAAVELITVINDKLTFTEEAIVHILYLSNRIPYFIQILCKYSGFYAVENKKRFIGYPEVEFVTKVLTNEITYKNNSMVRPLAPGIFQNNQYSPQEDANEVTALLSTLSYLNKNNKKAIWIRSSEIEEFWDKNGVSGVRRKVTEAIEYLKERGILESKEDEQLTVYRIGVDLFRRWWANENPDIELKLGQL